MLSAPQETLELQVKILYKQRDFLIIVHFGIIHARVKLNRFSGCNMKFQQAKQSKPVAVTSLAFPTGDVNNFVVGSEDGAVYTACRYFIYKLIYR